MLDLSRWMLISFCWVGWEEEEEEEVTAGGAEGDSSVQVDSEGRIGFERGPWISLVISSGG